MYLGACQIELRVPDGTLWPPRYRSSLSVLGSNEVILWSSLTIYVFDSPIRQNNCILGNWNIFMNVSKSGMHFTYHECTFVRNMSVFMCDSCWRLGVGIPHLCRRHRCVRFARLPPKRNMYLHWLLNITALCDDLVSASLARSVTLADGFAHRSPILYLCKTWQRAHCVVESF